MTNQQPPKLCGFLACGMPTKARSIKLSHVGMLAAPATWRGHQCGSRFLACDDCKERNPTFADRWERLPTCARPSALF